MYIPLFHLLNGAIVSNIYIYIVFFIYIVFIPLEYKLFDKKIHVLFILVSPKSGIVAGKYVEFAKYDSASEENYLELGKILLLALYSKV